MHSRWFPCLDGVHKWFLISKRHPHTYRHFRSYPTLVAERQRQIIEGDRCLIHPLSCFSLYWNSFMALVNIAHMCLAWFRLSFVLHALGQLPALHAVDHALLALQLVCFVDIVVKFHTGFLDRNSTVTLERLPVVCHYLQRYFFLDLVSALPVTYVILSYDVTQLRFILVGQMLAILKVFSICRDLTNIVTFIERFRVPYVTYGSIRNAILFCISVHLLSCLTFLHGAVSYYWSGSWPKAQQRFLTTDSSTLPNIPLEIRYKKAMFLCFSAFFGTSYSIYTIYEPVEILVHCITMLYAALFMVYTLVYLLKVYFTKYHSVIRYHELMSQLEEYMRHKQFPAALKKRVFAFYYYRYQGTYFREDTVLGSLSDQLRNEITLHTSHKLVSNVALFDGLPASVVGTLLGCLRAEVYLPQDLVMRAGDIGDCMYFIASGTVAVYSLKGVEVCHLEDGAYFGEVALLMKDSKRVATAVAVEITQVYRLDADHFRYFIETYTVLHERIEALASQRMNETVLLDEAFKRDRDHDNKTSSGTSLYQRYFSKNFSPSHNAFTGTSSATQNVSKTSTSPSSNFTGGSPK